MDKACLRNRDLALKSPKFTDHFPDFSAFWIFEPRFTGTYEDNKGQGELVEVFGFGVAIVDDQLRLGEARAGAIFRAVISPYEKW